MGLFQKGKKDKEERKIVPFFDDEDDESVVVENFTYVQRIFAEKMMLAPQNVKDCYAVIKSELLSIDGVKSRLSRRSDTFSYKGKKLAVVSFSGKALKLHLALEEGDTEQRFYCKTETVGKYADVPVSIRVLSARSISYAKILITRLADKNGLNKSEEPKPYDVINDVESYLLKSSEKSK